MLKWLLELGSCHDLWKELPRVYFMSVVKLMDFSVIAEHITHTGTAEFQKMIEKLKILKGYKP